MRAPSKEDGRTSEHEKVARHEHDRASADRAFGAERVEKEVGLVLSRHDGHEGHVSPRHAVLVKLLCSARVGVAPLRGAVIQAARTRSARLLRGGHRLPTRSYASKLDAVLDAFVRLRFRVGVHPPQRMEEIAQLPLPRHDLGVHDRLARPRLEAMRERLAMCAVEDRFVRRLRRERRHVDAVLGCV